MNEITYVTSLIDTLSEGLSFHEANGDCGLYQEKDCSCFPYRTALARHQAHRQELKDANVAAA
jgi:hypothetical protein